MSQRYNQEEIPKW